MSAKSSIDLHDPRSIIGSRIFEAPRELVFSAFTDPKHLARWWGPDGFTTTTLSFDFRPGGAWRFVMHGPDGRDYQNRVTYDEILPPERIVYRHGGGDDVEPVQFTQTLTFEELDGGRTRLVWHGRFPSAQERDRVIKEYGADKGLSQTMARLADYLATMNA
ncbi:MAG TPA: SRPBCC family protein [Xanthobacteraceae bacterium]|nr:SRPBCC family protein [Xanthobacteraceae bacterium]